MRKTLGFVTLCVWAVLASAADPGGQPGFVKAVFTATTFDTGSDVFANATTWVLAPEEMYADDLDPKTTVAYGGYMRMEQGVRYDFRGCYSNSVAVKIDSRLILSGSKKACAGSYMPSKTDWYRIDLRVASGARWRGGCRGDAQCGIFWKTEHESTWRKFVGIDGQFKTGTLPSHVRFEKPYVEVVSSQTRDEDSSVMDVTYVVWSPADKVNVRALAFEDGVRSFANVIRPTTFLDGSVIGDNVPANTTNTFSWKVSADWKSERAEAFVEVLAQDVGAGLVPLDFATIPARDGYGEVVCSTNVVMDTQYRDALYWLYATGDADLSLKDGWLYDASGRLLAAGTDLAGDGFAAAFVYGKMGYDAMGTNCQWPHATVTAISRIRGAAMPYSGNHRYAVKGLTAPPAQTMGGGRYMVIDLDSANYGFPVTYLDAAPSVWGDEYKTSKIVLRRIDGLTGGAGYAGVFEITEAQWDRIMGGSSTNAQPMAYLPYEAIRGDAGAYDWPTSNAVATNSFMGALRLLTGISAFDLPSEAEWEHAARAGVSAKWLCGDSAAGLSDYAWYSENSGGATHPVGTRAANAWGLYDVHGNVREWCLDRYDYSGRGHRVLRGGACFGGAEDCAFDARCACAPSGWWYCSGFRLFCRPVAAGETVEVSAADGTLDQATAAQIHTALVGELSVHSGVKAVKVTGDRAFVPLALDLGIAPRLDVLGAEATATYAAPALEIVAFDPETKRVRIRVTPGEGNAIRAPLAEECIHVYGASDLSQEMQPLDVVRVDLTPYLADGTKGEADLTVALDSQMFIKVKAEAEIR